MNAIDAYKPALPAFRNPLCLFYRPVIRSISSSVFIYAPYHRWPFLYVGIRKVLVSYAGKRADRIFFSLFAEKSVENNFIRYFYETRTSTFLSFYASIVFLFTFPLGMHPILVRTKRYLQNVFITAKFLFDIRKESFFLKQIILLSLDASGQSSVLISKRNSRSSSNR